MSLPASYGEANLKLRFILLTSIVLGSLLGFTAWRLAGAEPTPPPADIAAPSTPSLTVAREVPVAGAVTTPLASAAMRAAYVVSRPGTALRPAPDESGMPIAGEVVFPILAAVADGYRILDTCNTEGWVASGEVEVGSVPERASRHGFDQAVFVIDPGHGLPDLGAVGPSGLTETEVNLDVSARLVALLQAPRDVDWATGAVTPGSMVPAAAAAVLTRSPSGPNGGDYQLGLTFRAAVANALDATAFVSIHHNTAPETTLDHPGSEAYVSLSNPDSPRLGGLIVQELRASLARLGSDWTGTPGDGVISRVDADGSDYYTVLEQADVPAAIIEGVYISNPAEEALALTDGFRQVYAEAVYRALVRFVTTDDDPIPAPEPVLWEVDRPGPSMDGCEVPSP